MISHTYRPTSLRLRRSVNRITKYPSRTVKQVPSSSDISLLQLGISYLLYSCCYVVLGQERGHMVGHWPFLSSVNFPNTVVALGVNKSGEYDWVIEFQCIEVLGKLNIILKRTVTTQFTFSIGMRMQAESLPMMRYTAEGRFYYHLCRSKLLITTMTLYGHKCVGRRNSTEMVLQVPGWEPVNHLFTLVCMSRNSPNEASWETLTQRFSRLVSPSPDIDRNQQQSKIRLTLLIKTS